VIELARDKKPNLILLDIMMPQVNGLEACRILKAAPATRHISVIMLTASGGTEEKKRGKEMGADGYILKPFRPPELLSKVKEFVH